MAFSDVKGLTDEQLTQIKKHHDDVIAELSKDRDALSAKQKKIDEKKSDYEKLRNASTVDDMKKLLDDQNKRADALEQRILDDEKQRVSDEKQRVIGTFVDKFVGENVVPDSLVRDAIKVKISKRLDIRDNNIVEMHNSELTGRTGEQLLAEIKADRGYSNHMIANKARGGGAIGSAGGTGEVIGKSISRTEYDEMAPLDAARHFKDGGTIHKNSL